MAFLFVGVDSEFGWRKKGEIRRQGCTPDLHCDSLDRSHQFCRCGSGQPEGRLGTAYVVAASLSILVLSKNPYGEHSAGSHWLSRRLVEALRCAPGCGRPTSLGTASMIMF